MMIPQTSGIILAERQVELMKRRKRQIAITEGIEASLSLTDAPSTLPRWRRWVGKMMVNVGEKIVQVGGVVAQRQFYVHHSGSAMISRTRADAEV